MTEERQQQDALGPYPKGLARRMQRLLVESGVESAALARRWAEASPEAAVADLLTMRRVMSKQADEIRDVLDRVEAMLAEEIATRGADVLRTLLQESTWPVKHEVRMSGEPWRAALQAALAEHRERVMTGVLGERTVRWGHRLPAEFGRGMDERILEIPLAVELLLGPSTGLALDAGAALNLPEVHKEVLRPGFSLWHVTQSAEKEELTPRAGQVSYLFSDLRSLPFRDGLFDRVLSVSTLEHVGMDNSRYGGMVEHDPTSALTAATELLRVTAPGGVLFLTVPSGRARSLGWFRVFGPAELAELLAVFDGHEVSCRHFRHEAGWRETAVLETGDEPDELVLGMTAVRVVKR